MLALLVGTLAVLAAGVEAVAVPSSMQLDAFRASLLQTFNSTSDVAGTSVGGVMQACLLCVFL
jgi:hypothetical protein